MVRLSDVDTSCGALLRINIYFPFFILLSEISLLCSAYTCWWQRTLNCDPGDNCQTAKSKWTGPFTTCYEGSLIIESDLFGTNNLHVLLMLGVGSGGVAQILSLWSIMTRRRTSGALIIISIIVLELSALTIFLKCYATFCERPWHEARFFNIIFNFPPPSSMFTICSIILPFAGLTRCCVIRDLSTDICNEEIFNILPPMSPDHLPLPYQEPTPQEGITFHRTEMHSIV